MFFLLLYQSFGQIEVGSPCPSLHPIALENHLPRQKTVLCSFLCSSPAVSLFSCINQDHPHHYGIQHELGELGTTIGLHKSFLKNPSHFAVINPWFPLVQWLYYHLQRILYLWNPDQPYTGWFSYGSTSWGEDTPDKAPNFSVPHLCCFYFETFLNS